MTQAEEKPVEVKQEEENTPADENEASIFNQKLMTQVEYYFGDVNLPRDKFIKEECSKNDGWFAAVTLLKFNRVADILKDIPKDDRVKAICEALKASELIDVNEEKQKIRRSPECPLPEKDAEERTIYLKGFHRTETTLDDLLEFFKSKYEGVESIIMRYYKEKTIKTEAEIKKEKEEKEGISSENGAESVDAKKQEEKSEPQLVWVRKFKGSVFVVFKTIEQAKKLLDETAVDFNGASIQLKMWQADYKALKTKEYQDKMASRKRKGGAGGDKNKNQDDEGGKEEETKEEVPKGALLKLLNIPEGYTREIIKEKWFEALDKDKFSIAFIDFNKGDKNAVLRLDREGAATEALETIPEKKLKMKDAKEGQEVVTSEMEGFDGEEEAKYAEEIKRQRETMKHKKKGFGGRGGRGGRGGKRRRRY